jgi:5-methylcytosine-specific restriction endonuclease McrA
MKICINCNKEFKENRKEQKFCSKSCWNANHKATYISLICTFCNKKFSEREKRILDKRGKYCSKQCYSLSMKKLNKKTRSAINRDYRSTHRELTSIWKHNRRSKIFEFGGTFTKQQWIDLLQKCNFQCKICKKNIKLSVDHIIPLTKWKDWSIENNPEYNWNDIQNIQPLCISCNSKKGNEIK